MANFVVDVSNVHRNPNELVITSDGVKLTGWEDIRVTLRCEGFPNDFRASFSVPAYDAKINNALEAGKACTVYLGEDVIITGFIDRVANGGNATGHVLEVAGRGATQDLADCHAEWPGGSISGTPISVIQKISSRYGINVSLSRDIENETSLVSGQLMPFLLNYGESAADLVQRIAHSIGLMAYERSDGSLFLSRVGNTRAASGIAYGDNVQSWSIESSMTERYSDLVCVRYTQDLTTSIVGGNGSGIEFYTAKDTGVPRHRLIYVPLEMAKDPYKFTEAKANWDQARRIGRSCAIHATIDSWRDKEGKLFLPNTLVDVDLPGAPGRPGYAIGATPFCISEVTFSRNDATGTTAEITAMLPDAFAPEPFSLVQTNVSMIKGPGQ